MRIIFELDGPDLLGRAKRLIGGEPGFDGPTGEPGPMGPMGPAGPAFDDPGLLKRLEASWDKLSHGYDVLWERVAGISDRVSNLIDIVDLLAANSVTDSDRIAELRHEVAGHVSRFEDALSREGIGFETETEEDAGEGVADGPTLQDLRDIGLEVEELSEGVLRLRVKPNKEDKDDQ